MRLLKDLYQVAGCMYGVHENIYAIRTEEGIVLIDTGLHRETYYVIRRNLSYWGLDQQRIHKVLLTHCHYEHSGNCYRFEAEKADIYIHAAESEAIRKGSDRIAEYRFFGCEPYQPVQTCISVNDGEHIKAGEYDFEVLHTPGHSAGSGIYKLHMEDKTVLFTGDTVLADKLCREGMVGWTGGTDYEEHQYMDSLKRLADMEADVVLPGHGEVCMKDGGRLLNGTFLRARLLFTTQPHVNINTASMFR